MTIHKLNSPIFNTERSHTNNFYSYLHYFRGMSILLIVLAHCWSLPIFIFNDFSLPENLTSLFYIMEVLFHGSTIFFALISGILFSMVLRQKGYVHFYKNKLKNVVSPYIFVSIGYSLFFGLMFGFSQQNEQLSVLDIFMRITISILDGTTIFHLWYIPILLLMFLLTPVLDWFIERRNIVFMLIVFTLPLLISRVWPDFSIYTLMYFLSPYCAGLLIGKHLEEFNGWVNKRKYLLFVVFTAFSMLYYFTLDNDIKFVELGFLQVNVQESLTYLIRMSLAFLLLFGLNKWVSDVPKWVNSLAVNSFAIYFLHMFWIIVFVFYFKSGTYQPKTVFEMFMFGLVTFFACIILSLINTIIIKKLAGRYSRYFIGS